MSYETRSFGFSYMLTPMVKRLLIANTAIFLVTLVVGEQWMFEWFAFQPGNVIFRPWGPFTYMFLHGGLGHIAVNMIALFFFGPPLENRWGEAEFLRYYVICGLGGVALSFLFLPNWVVGASASVMGVMLAFAMNWPNVPIYIWGIFPIQAKWLVVFATVAALLGAMEGASGSGVAHLAHLGGMLAGFLYLKADWRPSKKISDIRKAARKRRLAIVPRDEGEEEHGQSGSDEKVREDSALYDRVDAVLDKISAKGMASLTDDERELLDEVSRKHRTN